MREVIARPGIVREPGFLYFLRGNEIWRQPMRGAVASARREPERVWRGAFEVEPGYFYSLGPNAEVLRVALALGPSPAPPADRGERAARTRRLPLPLADAEFRQVGPDVPPALRSLLQLPAAQMKLTLRGRWSSITNEALRLLAAAIVEAEPAWVTIGPDAQKARIEVRTRTDDRFSLAPPIARAEVLEALRAVEAPPDAALVEFYETFGELDDFVLPSPGMTFVTELAWSWHAFPASESRHDAPVVCRAPNGDRLLLERSTGGFTWANREARQFRPAAASFAELVGRYLETRRQGRVFDAFSG